MTQLTLEPITAGELRAVPASDGSVITLTLHGTADLRAAPALETLLPQLHQEALRLHAAEVVVDLRELEFMSSSCFRSFVTWLSDLQDVPAKDVYHVRLLQDSAKRWQRRSLSALSCFAVDLVRLE